MTREEAIERVKMILEEATADEDAVSYVTSDDANALDMAIKALEQEPCGKDINVFTTDVISRQAALDAFGLSEKSRKYGGDHSGYDTIMLYEVQDALEALPSVQPQPKTGHWIPVSERLPELNRPLLVTAYHRVCYAHMISESGSYGYPVFRLHEIKDSDRGWVQETISHGSYSKGRIDAWMYIDIPEPYKAESEVQDADS